MKQSKNFHIDNLESINFHLTQRCNYKCKFCFAKYDEYSRPLKKEDQFKLITVLGKDKYIQRKLNFAGGEPTLIPYLPELIKFAKKQGLFTSLISNGSGINKEFLKKCGDNIDIIGLSIDTCRNETELNLGRCPISSSKIEEFNHISNIVKISNLIKDMGIILKINTVITPLNWNDDMRKIIETINPERWKVFQVHHIKGVNDEFFKEFGYLEQNKFNLFIKKHEDLNPIYETSDMIENSYCMITPDGRFYQDTGHSHTYSDPILKIGLKNAFSQIEFQKSKFVARGGDYFKNILDSENVKKLENECQIRSIS